MCVCAFVGKIFADVWSKCGRLICFPHWKELVNFLVLYRRHLFSPLRFLLRALCLIARPDMDGPSSSSLRRRGEGGCRVYGICGRLAERNATSPLFPCGKNRGDEMATIHIWGNFNSKFQHVKQGSKRAVFLFMLFCQAHLLKE